MKCPECNAELSDDTKLCTNCGAEISSSANGQETAAGTEAVQQGEEQVVVTEQALEPSQPEPEKAAGNNGNRKKYILGGAVAAAIVLIAILAFGMIGKKDPKTAVIDAFKSIYTKTGIKPAEEIFGWKELAANTKKLSHEKKFDIKLVGGEVPGIQQYVGSGLSIESKTDSPQKKGSFSMALQFGGMDFLNLDLYADDMKILAAVPDLSSKVFALDYVNDIEGRLENSSYIGKLAENSGMDLTVLADYFHNLRAISDQGNPDMIGLTDLWNRYQQVSQAVNNLKKAMAVTEKDKKTLAMDGKEVKCQGYDVLISKNDVLEFINTTSKFFLEDETFKEYLMEYYNQVVDLSANRYGLSEESQTAEELFGQLQTSVDQFIAGLESGMGDVAMTVYVDKKGRMASLDLGTTITQDYGITGEGEAVDTAATAEIKLHAAFMGGNYLTQNMMADISMSDEGSTIGLTLKKNGTYDKKNLTCDLQLGANDGFSTYGFSYSGQYNVDSGDYDITLAALQGDVEQLSLSSQGNVNILTKGKAYDIVMDQIDIKAAGATQVSLSGDFSLKPMEGEITEPEGEKMDVLAASEEEWIAVGNEMMRNLFVYLMGMQQ